MNKYSTIEKEVRKAFAEADELVKANEAMSKLSEILEAGAPAAPATQKVVRVYRPGEFARVREEYRQEIIHRLGCAARKYRK